MIKRQKCKDESMFTASCDKHHFKPKKPIAYCFTYYEIEKWS